MAKEDAAPPNSGSRRSPCARSYSSFFLVLAGIVLSLGLLFSCLSVLLVILSPCHGEESEGTPAFRRLLLPPERLPEELKRVQEGVLVRLPAAEFDSLVERATQAGTRKIPPRLVEARYHAILKEDCLIGEGQWKLIHKGPGPGLLNLQPCNLALRQARFENGDALIAAFDGKVPALLVETPGERTVSLDWSARAESGPEGLQFHLEMPSCPVALLELDVPADRSVAILNDSALLSGPHEAETADLRRWKIICNGRQSSDCHLIDVRISPADRSISTDRRDAGPPDRPVEPQPIPFVHQKTTQKLNPEGLDTTFELTLDGLSHGIRELVCECDAELRLRNVIGPGVDGCSFQAGDRNNPSRLTIRLREPVRAGTWQILCLAPLDCKTGTSPVRASGGGASASPVCGRSITWRSPGLRVVNSVPRGETLTLWLHPNLRIEDWDPGSFRLNSADLDRGTGAQVLTLAGGGLGPPRRPVAQLQAYGVEFSTQQLTWWRCDAAGMSLTVQIGWDVSQGQLFQLPILLPAGWEVEKVEMTPAALLSTWYIRKIAGKTTLFVDLASPLVPPLRGKSENRNLQSEIGSNVAGPPRRLPVLTLHLRPAWSGLLTGQALPFPDVAPLGARFREGVLALDCDEQLFHLQVQTTAEHSEPDSQGPWGQQLPQYYYRYRGQPVTGEIRVRPRPPRLRAKCRSEIFIADTEAVVETHLLVETEAGSPNTIEVLLSAGDGEAWSWQSETSPHGEEPVFNRVRRVERIYSNELSSVLHLLAAAHPLQAAVVQAVQPTGERWRLTLTRSLRVREPLRLYARRRLQSRDHRWDVPLPIVFGAERMEGEVVLHPAGAGRLHVQSVGLRESASETEKAATPWRTFHYGRGEVRLTLSGETRASEHAPVVAVERARLLTYASEKGVLHHHFSFQIADWHERTLPLRLPPGARLLAAQVDGQWLPHLIPHFPEEFEDKKLGPIELALPVPRRTEVVSESDTCKFEIVYTTFSPDGALWRALNAPLPQLPVAPLAFRRLWRLPPKLVPLHQERYQSPLGAADKVTSTTLLRHAADLFRLPPPWGRLDPLREGRQADADERSGRAVHPDGEWNEWEPIAGQTDEPLLVVHREGITALGLALAFLWALLFWLRRHTARRRTYLLSALVLSGLGVLWLPASLRDLAWWPLLVSSVLALLEYLRAVAGRTTGSQPLPHPSKNSGASAGIAGILVLGFLGWNGRAAAPTPVTVYVVPGSADVSDKPTVLAPAVLVDRLKTLARSASLTLGGPPAVLLDAAYEGQLVDEGRQAEFAVVFSAYNLSEGPATLPIPLAGVQLVGEVLLDGARAAPLAAPQASYTLPVRGRGRHKIELRFRVPVVGTVEDRNVLFTVPPLMRSRLSWRIPPSAVEPQVLVKNGAQWTKRDSGGQFLEADLGALPLPVHLHWYQPTRPTRVRYQAAYLWDLGLERSYLTAYLRYRVEQGAIKTLELDLPAELEVSSANAQRTASVSRPSWRSRFQLRDWYVTRSHDKRVLHLELPYPISGDFQVTLVLLPHAPLTSPVALPLPSPRGIPAGGPHYLAYRTQPGLSAQRETSQNLTRIGVKEFAPDWWEVPSLETNFPGVAYRVSPDQPPQLLLRLEYRPPVVQGDVAVAVRIGRQRAEIEMLAEVTAPNKDLVALAWDLPSHCFLATVSGEDVRTWKQNGSRLLVWLNRTTAKTRIQLGGWLPLSLRNGQPRLELNGPRLHHADRQHTRLRLVTDADLVLTAMHTQNLQSASGSDQQTSADHSTTFETWKSSYHLDCQLQPAVKAIAQVLTLAEAADRELRFTTTVNYTITRGELRQVQLRLRNWEEEKVEVQAERVALLPGARRGIGERTWLLPLQAGVRGHYQVKLHGRMPLDKAAEGVPMPEVLVQGVERAEYFLAVVGGELTGQPQGALQLLNSPRRMLQTLWPDAARLLARSNGQVWRVNGSEWQLRLALQSRTQVPAPVQVYLWEQWAAVVDDRHWLHEACCWLRHETHADLAFQFAEPIRVLAVAIDDGETTTPSAIRKPQSVEEKGFSNFGFHISDVNKRVWLPLPDRPGVCRVRLRWMYEQPEPLDHPNLSPPQLAGAIAGPTLWTVVVPPGWQAPHAGAWTWQGRTREAARALCRADAQLRISQDLAKQRSSETSAALATAQQRFALYCRQAQQALDAGADNSSGVGPQGRSLIDWLEELQAKNRVLKSEIRNLQSENRSLESEGEGQRVNVEERSGIPVSWQAPPGVGPPVFQLTSSASQQTRQALAASLEWLGILAVVWLLSLVPFLPAWLRLFWPEQIALLGAFGWRLAGLTSIVLGLLLIAGSSRLVLLIRGLCILVRRRRAGD